MATPIFLNIDVNLDFSNTRDISISVGVDMPTVYIGQEIRKGQPYEPVAIKTIPLGVHGRDIGNLSQLCNFKQIELTKPRYPIRICRLFLGIRSLCYSSKN